MKLVINTAHQRFGGAIQVALSFINECKVFHEHEYHVWVGSGVGKSLDEKEFPDNFHFYKFDFGAIDFKTIKTIQKTLRPVENQIKPDVMISTSGPTYYHSKCPQIIGFNLPLYIYPESPYLKNLTLKLKLRYLMKKRIHAYFFKRDAAAIVTQTPDVNKRTRKFLNTSKVYTVTNTANAYFRVPKRYENLLPDKKEGVFRFVCVTSYYLHKNLEIIPQIIRLLKNENITNVEFVLTLKDSDFVDKIGQNKNIINVGPVEPSQCPSLYNECDALFLPSLAECFSASYPEAMMMNKPIITTDLGFAKSICGDAALYFKAKNPYSALDNIKKLINNKKLQNTLIENGKNQLKNFDTPVQRAIKYLEICNKYI